MTAPDETTADMFGRHPKPLRRHNRCGLGDPGICGHPDCPGPQRETTAALTEERDYAYERIAFLLKQAKSQSQTIANLKAELARLRSAAREQPPTPPQDAAAVLDEALHRASVGSIAVHISDLIDGTYPSDLDPEAWAWRRVMKVAEEVGEVNEAMLGWLGENPRKGLTHTQEDVQKELLDVALAALAAIAHLDSDIDPLEALTAHSTWVYDRLRRALTAAEDETP